MVLHVRNPPVCTHSRVNSGRSLARFRGARAAITEALCARPSQIHNQRNAFCSQDFPARSRDRFDACFGCYLVVCCYLYDCGPGHN